MRQRDKTRERLLHDRIPDPALTIRGGKGGVWNQKQVKSKGERKKRVQYVEKKKKNEISS
jgi:hypothetical protein